MEPDAVLVSNTREWLLRAKEDLNNAQHDLMATPPFVRDALFHCQQVAKKATKAILTWHDSAFRKTHNLEELGELCTRIDGTLAPAVEDVTPLTEYERGSDILARPGSQPCRKRRNLSSWRGYSSTPSSKGCHLALPTSMIVPKMVLQPRASESDRDWNQPRRRELHVAQRLAINVRSGRPGNGEEESGVIHPGEGRVRKPDERRTCVGDWEGWLAHGTNVAANLAGVSVGFGGNLRSTPSWPVPVRIPSPGRCTSRLRHRRHGHAPWGG